MRPQDQIDFTTLAWVKGELDETLKQARQALEAYVEDASDVSQIRFCATYLHQVHGTLRMVELYGAAMVTEEMEHLAGALLDGRVADRDEAYSVLMRGIMQLPDYLERLQASHKDIPIVLLPLLNDLRTARGEKGLTEIALFTPNLSRELPAGARGPAQPLPEADLRAKAEPMRAQFQLALLKWFRNDDIDGNLTRLAEILDRLISQTHELEARRLFWVAAGVLEALRAKAFEPSLQLKQTIGKVEREIKRLADSGERSFRSEPPHELTRNLLYFVAHAPTEHGRIGEMREVFGLAALLPSEAEVEHARSSLSGHNRSLLDTVAGAIKEDLLRVKDALDLHLRNPDAEAAQLSSQVEVLERVSDTLGMLGLGVARRVVQEQRDAVRAVIQSAGSDNTSALLDIAGALLYVEASLDDQVEHLGATGGETQADGGRQLPAIETRRVMQALVKEAQVNFTRAKECFIGYIESSWEAAQLEPAPELLSQVAGVLRIVELREPAGYLDAIARFTKRELLDRRLVPDVPQMETLADALASLEYYLEGEGEQRPGRERILLTTHASLEKLGYWPIPEEVQPSESVALTAAQQEVGAPVPAEPERVAPESAPAPAAAEEHVVAGTQGLDAESATDHEATAPLSEAEEVPVAVASALEEAAPAPMPLDASAPAVRETAVEAEIAEPTPALPAAAAMPAAVNVVPEIEQGPITGGFEETSEEIDEEIREVFVEEVEEEIQNLGELLPLWIQAPTDLEQLKSIRRVFHTLKGSGRLVGALTLGEFAWRIESMLNRVLDHTIAPTPAVTTLVETAFGVLPEIHAALRGERSVRTDLEAMKDVADRLAAGEQAYYVPSPAAQVSAPEPQPEEIIAVSLPVGVELAPEAEVETASIDAVQDDATPAQADAAAEAETELEVPVSKPADDRIEVPAIDPVLFEILKPEVAGHLDTIETWLERADEPLNESVVRAVHTMNGAFAMTELPLVTEVTSPMEHYLKRALAHALAPSEQGREALHEATAALRRVLVELEGHPPRLTALNGIASRLCAERDLLPDTPNPFAPLAVPDEVIPAPELSAAVSIDVWTPVAGEESEPAEDAPTTESAIPEPVFAVEYVADQPELTSVVSIPLAEELAAEDGKADILDFDALIAAMVEGTTSSPAVDDSPDAAVPEQTQAREQDRVEPIEWVELVAQTSEEEQHTAPSMDLEVVELDDLIYSSPQAETLEAETVEAEIVEAEIVEAETVEAETLEAETVEAETFEAETVEAETVEAETVEAETVEAETVEAETVEAEAIEALSFDAAGADTIDAITEPNEPVAETGVDALIRQWLENEAVAETHDSTSLEAETMAVVEPEAPESPHAGAVSADDFFDRLAADESAALIVPDAGDELTESGSSVADTTMPESEEPAVRVEAEPVSEPPGEETEALVEPPEAEEFVDALIDEPSWKEVEAQVEVDEAIVFGADEPDADEPEAEVTAVVDPAPAAAAPAVVDPRQLLLAAWFTGGLDSADPDPEQPLRIADMDEELLDIFGEEASDILDHSDGLMARLREAPGDRELVVALQRDLHTLKGGARMAGLHAIGDLGHVMESLLEIVAEGRRELPRYGLDVLELAFDRLNRMTARVAARQAIAVPALLVQRVDMLARGEEPELALPDEQMETGVSASVEAVAAAPAFAPAEAVPAPRFEEAAAAFELAPTALDDEDISVRAPQEQIRIRADLLDRLVNYAGEVAIYRARLEQQLGLFRANLAEMEQTNERLRGQLRKLEIETEAQIVARYQREAEAGGKEAFDPLELDRFSTLQQLSRALSESAADLVNLQGTLEDHTRQYETLLLQQSRVSSDLQEGLMRTRMVPFDSLVPRMRRIIRQTASELGKKAQLRVEGAQGEMDRSVLDRMTAPLEHMLRNGLAHGLETPEERRALGKPEEGTIRIAVLREGSEVVIKVSDDGRGLDRDAIRRKAIDRGLLSPDAKIADQALYAFILESGFSTATTVSKIAGRGVGMDVVHSEIRQLGGSLSIESERGKGSVFTVRLPFTLAVTQAVFVQQGDTSYAIPIASVQGVARIDRSELEAQLASGSARFVYAGEDYAINDLGRLLGQPSTRAEGSLQVPLLLARSGDQRAAICVDHVIGSREIVVKPVGAQVSSIPGIFGATIMGDGRVIVILDVAPLVRRYAALHRDGEVVEAAPVAPVSRVPLVMVVDDSITMRKVTGRVLERHGYEVLTAKDGVDAIEKLTDRVPDVMLLDIEMPRMDGYELATHIRNDVRLRGIPIIMITSRTGEKHRQRAFEIGVDRYLGKPYQEADLMRNVDEILKVHRGDRG